MDSEIFDISPLISPQLAVFPGDTPFSRELLLDTQKGDHFTLSRITTTLHLGAHADGLNHYSTSKEGVEARTLNAFLGKCQVIEAKVAKGSRISELAEPVLAKRVLFKTGTFPNPNHWNSDFAALSPELIHSLNAQGVVLVGIDTPSVDPESSKKLESHQALFATRMAVLEGLVLTHVPAGVYTLVAPPLKISGADASPVRALLLKNYLWIDS